MGQDEDQEREERSERRAELDAALQAWDESGLGASVDDVDTQGIRLDFGRLWITLGLGMITICFWTLWLTRHEVGYWAQRGSEPRDLGSLKARYIAGERTLDVPSNSYVKISGIFGSYEAEGSSTRGGATQLHRFYLDPLFQVVVRTSRPPEDKPYHRAASLEVEEGLLPILEARKAFPYDLVNTTRAMGRLIKASDAPRWHRKPIRFFASVARLEPSEMWLLLEDESPESYGGYVLIWGLAILLALSSATLVGFSLWRRKSA